MNINILAITDLHYIGTAEHICNLEDRKAGLALEFIQRIIDSEDLNSFDLIALLGDLVDNGKAPGAEKDIEALYQELKKTGKPVIVVPGNHDTNAELVFTIFNDFEGLHEINGCQIITFADAYENGDVCARSMEKMKEFFSKADPNKPVIVMQHNPIYPYIESPYPYNLINAGEVMRYYTEKDVLLSVSGHAHWGIPTQIKDNVGYLTCPALCEEPYRYSVITINHNKYEIKECSLSFKGLGLCDWHVHTQFAYCSVDMDAQECLNLTQGLGLERIAFTEHAAQLYVPGEHYWSSDFINDPDLILKYRNTEFNRMKKYREEIGKLRSSSVLLGLEVEVDCNFNLALLEEDRQGWDILVGAVHYLPKTFEKGSKSGFMKANEALMRNGVEILAHPFRYFARNKLPIPNDLYKPLAELLAYYNTAVELNCTYENDLKFIETCLQFNVPISLGSDAHLVYQAGLLNKHLELLNQIISTDQLPNILYQPKGKQA